MVANIGLKLQEARRNKEISLQKASEETKIEIKYLEALEKEEYEVFPAKIYVVSFLGRYGRYLGLDADSLVNIFNREHSGEKERWEINPEFPIVATRAVIDKSTSGGRSRALRFIKKGAIPFLLAILSILMVGLGVIFYLQSVSRQLFQQGTARVNISANIPKDIHIVAEISDKTWVRVVRDGVVFFEGTLLPGEKKAWAAKNQMSVRMGNWEGIKLYVNGEKVDTNSGDFGRVNELVFTKVEGSPLIKMERKRRVATEKKGPTETELSPEERK